MKIAAVEFSQAHPYHPLKEKIMRHFLSAKLAGFLAVFAFLALCVPCLSRAEDPKPIVKLSVSGYNSLFTSVKKVVELSGNADAFDMIARPFARIPGLNGSKPFGFVLFADEEEETFIPVVFFPITDLGKVREKLPVISDWLENFEEVDQGRYEMETPFGSTYVLEQKKNWLVLYPEDNENILPEDPSELLDGLNEEYQIALMVDFENTPTELVLTLFAPIEMIVAIQNPDAVDQVQNLKQQIERILEEGKILIEGLSVDSSGNLILEAILDVQADSSMGEALAYVKDAKSRFQGFFQTDQALALLDLGQISDEEISTTTEMIENHFEGLVEQMEYELEEEELEVATEVMEKLSEIIVATIEKGRYDVALSWLKSGDILFATSIAEGEELNGLLETVVESLSESNSELGELFQLNYESFEDYQFNKVVIPVSLIPGAYQLPDALQEKNIEAILAVGEDSLCGILGLDGNDMEKTLKKAIRGSQKPFAYPKRAFVASLPKIAEALSSTGIFEEEPVPEAVLSSLSQSTEMEDITADRTITIQSETARNKVRITFPGSVISGIAKAVLKAQQAQIEMSLNTNPFEDSQGSSKAASPKVKDFDF